jgi:hypothetical protein
MDAYSAHLQGLTNHASAENVEPLPQDPSYNLGVLLYVRDISAAVAIEPDAKLVA